MSEAKETMDVTIVFTNGTQVTYYATPEVVRKIATDVAIGKDSQVYDVQDEKGHKRVLAFRWREVLYVG